MTAKDLHITGFVLVLTFAACQGTNALPPTFQRTIVVDRTSTTDANTNTIEGALDLIQETPNKYTILVYGGQYDEQVNLDGTRENIDIVGVDRDAVIINYTGSTGAAVLITSGSETSRNNSIRNVTIKSSNAPGILIDQVGQVPKNIIFENVTIQVSASNQPGINAFEAQDVLIRNCLIDPGMTMGAGDGIQVGTNTTVVNTTVNAKGSGSRGILSQNKNNLAIRGCNIAAQADAAIRIEMLDGVAGATLERSLFTSGTVGVDFLGGDRVLIQDCVISVGDSGAATGVKLDASGANPLKNVTALGCKISAKSTGANQPVRGIDASKGPTGANQVRFEECEITATVQNASPGAVSGVFGNQTNAIYLVGGVITTSVTNAQGMPVNKAPDVFDLHNNLTGGAVSIFMSGTRQSKQKGPIGTSERRRPVTQNTVNVAAGDSAAIHPAVPLNQPTDPMGQPDVYRVLSVKGSSSTLQGNVFIRGTDWAGKTIVDKIQLDGENLVPGVKPFKTVAKILVEPTGGLGTVSIGTLNILGLYQPIAAATDVIQQGRKASTATSYTLEAIGTVDPVYSTVNVSSTITGGSSFERAVLASE